MKNEQIFLKETILDPFFEHNMLLCKKICNIIDRIYPFLKMNITNYNFLPEYLVRMIIETKRISTKDYSWLITIQTMKEYNRKDDSYN